MKIYLREHSTGNFLNQNGRWLPSSMSAREFSSTEEASAAAQEQPFQADVYFSFRNDDPSDHQASPIFQAQSA